MSEAFEKINFGLLVPAVLLCSLSVVVLFSISPEHAKQQIIYFFVGLLFFFLFSMTEIGVFKALWKHGLFVTNFLLLITHVIGREVKGSSRWITLGPVNFQPSEFAKVALVLGLAGLFSSVKAGKLDLVTILKSLVVVGPLASLTFIQPDFGTTIVFVSIYAVSLLFMRVNKLYLVGAALLIGMISYPLWSVMKDYQKNRVVVFVNPYADPLGAGYNVLQSRIAVGSGMIFGKGYGHGTQSKLKFLPEFHTDFIFASFAEEWGFVGVTLLLGLYTILLSQILSALSRAKTTFGLVVGVCVFVIFLVQVLVNVGMNLGAMPVTGIPLPLMSYGGSSIVTAFMALGLVNGVWLSGLKER